MLVGLLTPNSLDSYLPYTKSAPVEVPASPILFLTSDVETLTPEAYNAFVAGVDASSLSELILRAHTRKLQVTVRMFSSKVIYNNHLSLSQLIGYVEVVKPEGFSFSDLRQSVLHEELTKLTPYIRLMDNPMQSKATRVFMNSLQNSLAKIELEFSLFAIPREAPLGELFYSLYSDQAST
jgi:hypothetical protein